jgi:hypothetical protein
MLFRGGFLEISFGDLVVEKNEKGQPAFPWMAWEGTLLNMPNWIASLERCGILGPFLVSFALLNARGHTIKMYETWGRDRALIDREVLLTNEVELHGADKSLATTLKPLFDQIWNAFGEPESLSFHNGQWAPERWEK